MDPGTPSQLIIACLNRSVPSMSWVDQLTKTLLVSESDPAEPRSEPLRLATTQLSPDPHDAAEWRSSPRSGSAPP